MSSQQQTSPPVPSEPHTSDSDCSGEPLGKVCTVCGQFKALDEYRPYKGEGRFGKRPLCKVCQREYESRWRSKTKEYRQAQRQKRAVENKIYHQEYYTKHRAESLVSEARRRSAKKGIPFDLDEHLEEIRQRFEAGVCEMTGLQLDFHCRRISWNSPSMDRIEPALGYVYSNLRIVCYAMNAAMQNWGEETTEMVMRAWLEKRG